MPEPVILITGSRKGIGRALVDHYLSLGYCVFGCSRSPMEKSPEGYTHFTLDVSDDDAVQRMLQTIRNDTGRLDYLINNAGVASMNHILLTPASSMRTILETNILGTALCSREAAKVMKIHRFGRIINFATVATPLKLEGEALYASSKAAVVSLTEIMARELAPFGITVNAVGPTPVKTDLIRGVPEEKMEALLSRQAIKRFGEVTDIFNVIQFFLKQESHFITGQTLYLGGV